MAEDEKEKNVNNKGLLTVTETKSQHDNVCDRILYKDDIEIPASSRYEAFYKALTNAGNVSQSRYRSLTNSYGSGSRVCSH